MDMIDVEFGEENLELAAVLLMKKKSSTLGSHKSVLVDDDLEPKIFDIENEASIHFTGGDIGLRLKHTKTMMSRLGDRDGDQNLSMKIFDDWKGRK